MVCTWGWSLVQRSPTECGIPECDREASVMRTDWPTRGCWASGGGGFVRRRKHLAPHYVAFSTLLFPRLTQAQLSSSAPHSRTPSSHLPKLRNMINWKKHLFLRNRTVIRLIRAFFLGGGVVFGEHPSVHHQEDLYMQFYCVSFMHPYKESGRWQDVFDQKHIPHCAFIESHMNKCEGKWSELWWSSWRQKYHVH